MSNPHTKIKLTDDQRAKIRWSSTKRGFVFRAVHRSPRVRDSLVGVYTTRTECDRAAAKFVDRPWVWGSEVVDIEVIEVDSLGNVIPEAVAA